MKLNAKFIFISLLYSTISFSQQFQLKWETPAVPYPSGSIDYIGNFFQSGVGAFIVVQENNVSIYHCQSHSIQYSFNKQSDEDIEGLHISLVMPYLFSANQDYNGDGIPDFFVRACNTNQCTQHIVDPTNGNIIAQFDSNGTELEPWGVTDVDGDGKLELLMRKLISKISGNDYAEESILVFSTNISITKIPNSSMILPRKYQINQNYPNPFNPYTKIEYEIPQYGIVKINIYDISGKLIRKLINEQKNTGKYLVTWDGRNDSGKTVSSGTYFYQIISGNFVQAKKMILLK